MCSPPRLGLAGIGVVAWLAKRLADPITELTGQARAIADGDTDVAPRRSRVWEFDELGTALSTMADKVGERLSHAEQTTATLEVVLGALSQGTILFDNDDRVVYANAPARSMLGVVPDHLSGMAPLQFQEAVREARETQEPRTRVLDHGSPTRRLRGVATPFAGEDRILLLVEDITERDRTDAMRLRGQRLS